MRMPSTNNRCDVLVDEVILRTSDKPLLFASRIALLNPSTTNRKSRGIVDILVSDPFQHGRKEKLLQL